jgi:hypothetical protein
MSSPALAAAPSGMQRETSRLSSAAANDPREQGLPQNIDQELSQQGLCQDDIAHLAYALWQRRGSPDGTAEVDWLEAEAQLRK